MKDFKKVLLEYYDTFFPYIDEENVIRRTFIFYALLYLTLFFTILSIGETTAQMLFMTTISYIAFGLTASNFYNSKKIPNIMNIFRQFKGINLLICIFIFYFGFIFLLGAFFLCLNIEIFAFKYSYLVVILFLLIFLGLSMAIFFYYVKQGISSAYSKINININRKDDKKEEV